MTFINEVISVGSTSKQLVRGKSKFVSANSSVLSTKFPPKLSPVLDSTHVNNRNTNLNPVLSNLLTHPSTYPSTTGKSQRIAINLPVSIKKSPPSFYQKLNSYFPACEMKRLEHFLLLMRDKSHIYKVQESEDHVIVYSVIGEYLFVDYVWVSEKSRGKGIGAKIIRDLKKLNKVIILEVEQIDKSVAEDLRNGSANNLTFREQSEEYIQKVHAVKRLKFYKREGFNHATQVSYVRWPSQTSEPLSMEILFWDPSQSNSQHEILLAMRAFYREIHCYGDFEIYGKTFEAPDMVLQFRKPVEDMMLHV